MDWTTSTVELYLLKKKNKKKNRRHAISSLLPIKLWKFNRNSWSISMWHHHNWFTSIFVLQFTLNHFKINSIYAFQFVWNQISFCRKSGIFESTKIILISLQLVIIRFLAFSHMMNLSHCFKIKNLARNKKKKWNLFELFVNCKLLN